jgi:hypothetical protein
MISFLNTIPPGLVAHLDAAVAAVFAVIFLMPVLNDARRRAPPDGTTIFFSILALSYAAILA